MAAGPVLEEGCYCGCSSSMLALGLIEAAKEQNRKPHAFYTSDAFPISPTSDVKSPSFYKYVDEDVELRVMGKLVYKGKARKSFEALMEPMLKKDITIMPCLFRTLYRNNLTDVVSVIAGGSFGGNKKKISCSIVRLYVCLAPKLPYRLIFSDSAHSIEEIVANEHVITPHVFKGYPVLLVFHDCGTEPALQAYLNIRYNPVHKLSIGRTYLMETSPHKIEDQTYEK